MPRSTSTLLLAAALTVPAAATAQRYYFRERLVGTTATPPVSTPQPTRTCSVQFYSKLGGAPVALGTFASVAQVNAACSAIPGVTACGLSTTSGIRGFYTTVASPTITGSGVDYAAAACS